MESVATGVLRVVRHGPTDSHGLPSFAPVVNVAVRFPFLPPVGFVVVFEGLSFVVEGVQGEVVNQAGGGRAVQAVVRLGQATYFEDSIRPAGPGFLVRLIDEELSRLDDAYEGEVIHLPALPHSGEAFYEVRGACQIRYTIAAVDLVTLVEDGERRTEYQVVIRREDGVTVSQGRPLLPSRN